MDRRRADAPRTDEIRAYRTTLDVIADGPCQYKAKSADSRNTGRGVYDKQPPLELQGT